MDHIIFYMKDGALPVYRIRVPSTSVTGGEILRSLQFAMGKRGKQLAAERREQRRQEISELRNIPYSPADIWWTCETVAAVTGANRGIGYEISRQLAVHGLRVVLTARDGDRGRAAAEGLQKEGLNVEFFQLDITDADSVESFALWIASKYGGLDILVNNAGLNFNIGSENSVEFADKVIASNYFGTKRMLETMILIMRPSAYGARILNVSSRLGRVNGRRNRIGDTILREQLLNDDYLSEELVDGMVSKFLEDVKQGTWASNGWPQNFSDYSVSKLAVNVYTRMIAKRLSDRPEGQKIYINCYCPGWVRTAMTDWAGNSSPEEGADTGVWIVLQPAHSATQGKFFAERREITF